MDLTEKKLSGELKYTGVIVSVTLDKVELCDGHQTLREVVHHPGGVGVLPLDTDGSCYMVRQYRYPVGAPVLEIPAGKIDHHDDHLSTAVRELSEETGFTADEYIDLGCCYTWPGYTDEIIHVYLARGLHRARATWTRANFSTWRRSLSRKSSTWSCATRSSTPRPSSPSPRPSSGWRQINKGLAITRSV
jgi:ADP-ribose pyrophosphatase